MIVFNRHFCYGVSTLGVCVLFISALLYATTHHWPGKFTFAFNILVDDTKQPMPMCNRSLLSRFVMIFVIVSLCVCVRRFAAIFFFGRHSLNAIFDVCLCVHILCPLTTGDHCCVHWRYYLYCSKLATIISEHIILYRGPFAARAFVLCEETNIGIDSEKRKQICNVCW